MHTLLVIYATREGHTKRIAEHAAEYLSRRGILAELADAAQLSHDFAPDTRHRAVVIAASVHKGKHEPEMVEFVKRHREALDRLPSAFLSISLSEAAAHSAVASREEHDRALGRIDLALAQFRQHTGWTPRATLSVAGALRYRAYLLPLRWVMRAIARSAGLTTDTSRDHVFTDWLALDQFLDQFVGSLGDVPSVESSTAVRTLHLAQSSPTRSEPT